MKKTNPAKEPNRTNDINRDTKNKLNELKKQFQTNNSNKDKENNKAKKYVITEYDLETKEEEKRLLNNKKESSINLTDSNSKIKNFKEN